MAEKLKNYTNETLIKTLEELQADAIYSMRCGDYDMFDEDYAMIKAIEHVLRERGAY